MKKIFILCFLLLVAVSCSQNSSDQTTTNPPTSESALVCSSDADCTLTAYVMATLPDNCGCMPYGSLSSGCYTAVNVTEAAARKTAYDTYCKDKEGGEVPEECSYEAYCESAKGASCVDGKCVLQFADE